MSFNVVKEQAAQLPVTDRRRLVAYLVSLDDAQDVAYQEKLRTKIDDHTPGNWLSIQDVNRKLDIGENSK